jgi:hypothetical protein
VWLFPLDRGQVAVAGVQSPAVVSGNQPRIEACAWLEWLTALACSVPDRDVKAARNRLAAIGRSMRPRLVKPRASLPVLGQDVLRE